MMTSVWLLGVVAMALFGAFVTRFAYVQRLELPARVAIVFACGLVTGGVVMSVESLVNIPWTRTTLFVPLLLAACLWRRGERVPMRAWSWTLIAIAAMLTCYGSLTARQTTGDLLFFWGPKAAHFYNAERIDFAFLGMPHYFLMHSDYPPLLPLIYAFGSAAAHGMSLWGAILFSSLCIIAAAVAFRGMARNTIGESRAAAFASLLAAALAYGLATPNAAGGADALVYLFAIVAVSALTFGGEDRGALVIASIALTGLVLVKVEGLPFAIVILAAYLVSQRAAKRTVAMAVLPLIAIAVWIAAVYHRVIADAYTVGRKPFHPERALDVVRWAAARASYRAAWLPWIAAAVPFAFARNLRRAVFPLLVAGGTTAATHFFYLQGEESPQWWIESSVERVLLTSVAVLIVAAAASSADQSMC
jgi:hypothetical protein